jgi:hypothetical protein
MASREPSSPLSERSCPQWQLDYESALQETDHKTLFKRIEIAEAAMLERREVLALGPDGFAEQQQIKLALTRLRRMKNDVLKFT